MPVKASDFYFKRNTRGAKYYYEKLTGKRIAKRLIPEHLHDAILEKDNDLDLAELIKRRDNYLIEIDKLRTKLAQVELQIQQAGISAQREEELLKKRAEEDRQNRARQEQAYWDRVEKIKKVEEAWKNQSSSDPQFENIFNQYFNQSNQSYDWSSFSETSQSDSDILDEWGIYDKNDWRYWLRQNHPDKGGDGELCAKIISAGKAEGW